MHPPSRLFSTAAVALLLLGVAVPTPETTTTSTTVVRTSSGDRTSEDTRSLRATDAPTHEMTELDEDRYIIPSTNVLWSLEKFENAWKAVLAKTPWKDSPLRIPPKESSFKISRTISRQENPTDEQLKAREELLELVGKGVNVKDFDDWLQVVVLREKNSQNTMFKRWESAGLESGRLGTLFMGAGKSDDSIVFKLVQAFDKHVKSSLKIPGTISRQENPTDEQLRAREELLELAGDGINVKDFDDWLQVVVSQEKDFQNTLFKRWESAGLESDRLGTLFMGAGKSDDSIVIKLVQAFDKHVNSKLKSQH
uniref:RxLR effector candidate protein n=2 Tax=Hyaloperonospora arabidopsidis (strain Emoy2) TaxID=559515 RepID=M4BYE2_HYAAE